MFVDGRLSVSIVCPVVKFAGPVPLLARWTFHVQLLPSKAAPLTLSVLAAVRSGATTVIVTVLLTAPVPPSVEVTAVVVLGLSPLVVPVTSTFKVQDWRCTNVPAARLIELPLAVGVPPPPF